MRRKVWRNATTQILRHEADRIEGSPVESQGRLFARATIEMLPGEMRYPLLGSDAKLMNGRKAVEEIERSLGFLATTFYEAGARPSGDLNLLIGAAPPSCRALLPEGD